MAVTREGISGTVGRMNTDPRLLHHAALVAAGFTEDELVRMVSSGDLTRVRRGTYVAGPGPDEAAARHRLQVRASVAELAGGTVASHWSAAVLHRLPVWRLPLRTVSVTRPRPSGGRRDPGLHMRSAPLHLDEIVTVDGIRATSAARTVADLARSSPFEVAVVAADSALALGLATPAELEAAAWRCKGWPGAPGARRVAGFADPRAESVGESRSRVAIARSGLPEPHLQYEVRDRTGQLIGCTDFAWPEHGVVGEFDGEIKYGRLVPAGQSPGDVVFREKIREDAIRALGYRMVRWIWSELGTFSRPAEDLRERLAGLPQLGEPPRRPRVDDAGPARSA